MEATTRKWVRVALVIGLTVALCSAPALGHAAHESHDTQEEDTGLSIWPFLLVFGTVTVGGSVLAGYHFDVPHRHAIGVATGGAAMALLAAALWLG